MADVVLQASPGRDRFFRITTLLMRGGTSIVRGLFDYIHSPSTLANTLLNHKSNLEVLKRSHILTEVEWNKLFPSGSSYGKSEDFDLTLLFKLLRNICNLTMPSTGWDQLPYDANLSLEADLARIKYHRNVTYAHNGEIELSENEFNDCWVQIKDALLRIVGKYAPSTVKEWEEAIDKSRTAPITEEDKKIYRSGLPAIVITCAIKILKAGISEMASTTALLEEHERFLSAIQDGIFPTQAIIAECIQEGCVQILLRVKTVDALVDFWERYKNGKLRDDLENILVTEEIRRQGDKVEFTVTVSEDEYLHAQCFLKELIPKKVLPEAVKEVTETIEEQISRGLDEVLFLEKIGDYIEARKHKAYALAKQAEPKPSAEFKIIHGSKFQAHLAHVTSQDQVEQVLTQLKKDRKIANATYNMLAYRIYIEDKKTYLEEGRDDGEAKAWKRLLKLLQELNVENAVVIVTGWNGGVHIGPDTFKHINACATEVIELAFERKIIEINLKTSTPQQETMQPNI